jgi:hypothetical protein
MGLTGEREKAGKMFGLLLRRAAGCGLIGEVGGWKRRLGGLGMWWLVVMERGTLALILTAEYTSLEDVVNAVKRWDNLGCVCEIGNVMGAQS